MEKREVILEIKNLRTHFDTQDGVVHAVNGISYSLRSGETLGNVGESGCGKSVSIVRKNCSNGERLSLNTGLPAT